MASFQVFQNRALPISVSMDKSDLSPSVPWKNSALGKVIDSQYRSIFHVWTHPYSHLPYPHSENSEEETIELACMKYRIRRVLDPIRLIRGWNGNRNFLLETVQQTNNQDSNQVNVHW